MGAPSSKKSLFLFITCMMYFYVIMTSQKHLFYLAPLRGITDIIFRTSFEKYFGQFDFLMPPFITTVKGEKVALYHIKDISSGENDRKRVIPQIIGNDPEDMLKLASCMHDLGYHTVNWNLGCPFTPVTRKKRGSGLLPYPELIKSILDKLIPALPCSFSVKVRLGLDEKHELSKVIPVLNDYPLSEVIIHPRTGSQEYSGTVDLDSFELYTAQCRHTVVYNGDIFTADDFKRLSERFPGINRWMLGRGVVKYPFLLEALRSGKTQTEFSKLRLFHDDLYAGAKETLSGPSHILGRMKGLWLYMAGSMPEGQKLLKKIQKTKSLSAYERLIDSVLKQIS